MACTSDIESAILRVLDSQRSSTLEELVHSLPSFAWNDIFFAVDRLSREGKLVLRHPTRFEYLVSAPAAGDAPARSLSRPSGTAA